jgi:hypothetical protein
MFAGPWPAASPIQGRDPQEEEQKAAPPRQPDPVLRRTRDRQADIERLQSYIQTGDGIEQIVRSRGAQER